jgi:DEAD/DEAH box helicase domain-containing protein
VEDPEEVVPRTVSGIASFLAGIREEETLDQALRHHEVLPARPATLVPTLPASLEGLAPVLERRGIQGLYSHQDRAVGALARGRNVVLATPTASGKTLVYNLPVLHQILEDRRARAIYLFPLKALEQDQRRQLERDVRALEWPEPRPQVAIYDGDTPQSQRRKLRSHPPNVLITTPDMLHLGILPHHAAWEDLFQNLRLVVVDELHTYRGIFGSQVAQVLRRLDRVAAFHGARPHFIAASATIANPGELAQQLTGRDFEVVQNDGSPKTKRHVLLFKPRTSPYTLATQLFRLSVGKGLRTIAFTKARVITELMHTWVTDAEPEWGSRISSYRAGFLPEERREIEQRLFSGELLGVISTSALEMGIDVGGLDVCILVGYPGSQIATWQRGGRVGRTREAAIALVAQPDALDQYLVSHPKTFLERSFEHAVVDPNNREIAAGHLPCAAAEIPLREDEPWLRGAAARANLKALEQEGLLLESESGNRWFSARTRPHREVNLRATGSSYQIVTQELEGERPVPIGSIGAGRVWAECHQGAIYLHRGRQFLVTELAAEERMVRVRAVRAPYYTRALSEKSTEILSRDRLRPAGNFRLVQGRVRVTTTITGFERRHVKGQDLLGTEPLDLPPTSFETVGLWLEMPDSIPAAVKAAGGHPMGGIHAVEHAALSLFPLFALCDRHDVAGISHACHPQLRQAAVFFYDAHPGGVGLVPSLFDRLESLLDATLDLVESCTCEEGCPGCVHSPRCGSGNRPIDKSAAQRVLRLLLAREPLPEIRESEGRLLSEDREPDRVLAALPLGDPLPRILFFDLETQRSAEEVGGWHNAHLMRVSLAVTLDSRTGEFETFFEKDVPDLLTRLEQADLVVGFNVKRFDYRVLRGYTERDLSAISTFDMLQAIHQRIGFRLALDHLARETLGASKSADGLQALRWWKEGRLKEIEEYCRRDVALLRDLLEHAEEHGHLIFRTRSGQRVRPPAPWARAGLVEQVRAERARAGEPGQAPPSPGAATGSA